MFFKIFMAATVIFIAFAFAIANYRNYKETEKLYNPLVLFKSWMKGITLLGKIFCGDAVPNLEVIAFDSKFVEPILSDVEDALLKVNVQMIEMGYVGWTCTDPANPNRLLEPTYIRRRRDCDKFAKMKAALLDRELAIAMVNDTSETAISLGLYSYVTDTGEGHTLVFIDIKNVGRVMYTPYSTATSLVLNQKQPSKSELASGKAIRI